MPRRPTYEGGMFSGPLGLRDFVSSKSGACQAQGPNFGIILANSPNRSISIKLCIYGSKMCQANLVSSLDFRSATDAGFIRPSVASKYPLVLGLRSRNLLGLQDVVGDVKVRESWATQHQPNPLKAPRVS